MVGPSSADRSILCKFRAFLIAEGVEIFRDRISITTLNEIDECKEICSAIIEEAAVSGSTATIILTVAQPPEHTQPHQFVEARCCLAEMEEAEYSLTEPAPDSADSEANSILEQLSQMSLLSTQSRTDHAYKEIGQETIAT